MEKNTSIHLSEAALEPHILLAYQKSTLYVHHSFSIHQPENIHLFEKHQNLKKSLKKKSMVFFGGSSKDS